MDVSLRTNRLLVRPPMSGDVGAIVAGLNDFQVARLLTRTPYPYSEADARAWLATLQPPRPGAAHFAIELRGEGMIGVVSLEKELGYWLDRRFHGLGLMTEACVALLDWHFGARPDDPVASGAHVGNAASLNVQRKLGFVTQPGTEMRFVRSQGREIAHVRTVLTHRDYLSARATPRTGSWT